MDSPVTLRLDKATRARIARIARQKHVSASEVIREAIEAWVDGHEATVAPYENAADLIGVVRGGNSGRSTATGRQLKELLKGRRSRS
jgi:Arc/MetJ-type ribon-helix-helix transcriptional regulator